MNTKLMFWIVYFIIILLSLWLNPNLWPLGFIIPIPIIVISIIYSNISTKLLYRKNPYSSMLTGHLSYSIDKDGKPTKRYR